MSNYFDPKLPRALKGYGNSHQRVVRKLQATEFVAHSSDFSQPINRLVHKVTETNTAVGNTALEYMVQMKERGLEDTLQILKQMLLTLKNNVDDIATSGVQAVQERVIRRGEEQFPKYRYWYQLGKQPRTFTGPSKTLKAEFDRVLTHLGEIYNEGDGVVGFGSRRVLDSYRLRIDDVDEKLKRKRSTGNKVTDYERDLSRIISEQLSDAQEMTGAASKNPLHGRTNSPYTIAWQIIEFGTGGFARPATRQSSWRWLSNIQIYGQEGLHFLFGQAANAAAVRRDKEVAREAIAKRLREIYARRR